MGFHSMIVSEVDEIAWFFNMRAELGTSAGVSSIFDV